MRIGELLKVLGYGCCIGCALLTILTGFTAIEAAKSGGRVIIDFSRYGELWWEIPLFFATGALALMYLVTRKRI